MPWFSLRRCYCRTRATMRRKSGAEGRRRPRTRAGSEALERARRAREVALDDLAEAKHKLREAARQMAERERKLAEREERLEARVRRIARKLDAGGASIASTRCGAASPSESSPRDSTSARSPSSPVVRRGWTGGRPSSNSARRPRYPERHLPAASRISGRERPSSTDRPRSSTPPVPRSRRRRHSFASNRPSSTRGSRSSGAEAAIAELAAGARRRGRRKSSPHGRKLRREGERQTKTAERLDRHAADLVERERALARLGQSLARRDGDNGPEPKPEPEIAFSEGIEALGEAAKAIGKD